MNVLPAVQPLVVAHGKFDDGSYTLVGTVGFLILPFRQRPNSNDGCEIEPITSPVPGFTKAASHVYRPGGSLPVNR